MKSWIVHFRFLLLIIVLVLAFLFIGCSVEGRCEGLFRQVCVRAVMAISNATPCAERHEARGVEHRIEEECFDSGNLSTWKWQNGERVRVPARICVPRKSTIIERDCGR